MATAACLFATDVCSVPIVGRSRALSRTMSRDNEPVYDEREQSRELMSTSVHVLAYFSMVAITMKIKVFIITQAPVTIVVV